MKKDLESKIMQALAENGYEAYYVGGYVRDKLLGIESYDKDITTNASHEEMERILGHLGEINNVGKQFGVCLVADVEVAQYRSEEYLDENNKPVVKGTLSLEEDSLRRDFTINSMYMSEDGKIIDLHGGQQDIKNKVIRAVGNPDDRFKEDSSRILRGFYLASKLGFTIEQKTLESMQRNGEKLKTTVPVELKGKLLLKAIKGGNFAQFINQIMEAKLMDSFIPELTHLWELPQNPKYHLEHENAWYHVVDVVKQAEKMKPKDISFILGALLHDVAKGLEGVRGVNKEGMPNDLEHEEIGKPIAKKIVIRLGLGKEIAEKVGFIVQYHGIKTVSSEGVPFKDKSIRKIVNKLKKHFKTREEIYYGLEIITDFRLCDTNSMTDLLKTKTKGENVLFLQTSKNYLERYVVYPKDLPINGKDITEQNESIQFKYVKATLDYLISRNIQDREKALDVIKNLKIETLDNFLLNM